MNPQEMIDQNLRMLIGDLHIQLLLARAEIAQLRQQLDALTPKDAPQAPPDKPDDRPSSPH